MNIITEMQDHIEQLEAQLQAPPRVTPATTIPAVKVHKAECFDGTRSKLRAFLTQMDMHIDVNNNVLRTQASRVIFVSTYLRDRAFEWFEPILREYYNKARDNWGNITKEVFSDTDGYEKFRSHLNKTFGDVDATRTAERKLRHLRQTTSAVAYASEFQQITSHLDWDEEAYVAIFEDGLREEVKDELVRVDRPTDLSRMIELAVKIDNRLYERRRERDGTRKWRQTGQKYYPKYRTNHSQGQPMVTRTNDDPYGPRPMDLDATRHRKIPEEEKKRRQRDRLCFYCGKEGHTAWYCPNKRNHSKTNIGKPDYQLRAIQEVQPSNEVNTKKTITEVSNRINEHTIAATQLGKHLKLTARISNKSAIVLLDSGATGNFMDPNFQEKIGILGKPKVKPTLIRGLNGKELETVLEIESGPLPMIIQNHMENINFDVTPLGEYDIVLGIPWLQYHNPTIDWKTGNLQFNQCQCSQTLKKQPWLTKLDEWAPQTKEELYQALIDHDDLGNTCDIAATTEDCIPKEYKSLQELFQIKEKPPLPEHGPHDHEIPILPGKEPKYMPIYQLSETELAVL